MTHERARRTLLLAAVTFGCAQEPDQASQQPPVNAALPAGAVADSTPAPPPPSPNKSAKASAHAATTLVEGKLVASLDMLTIATPDGPRRIDGALREELKTLAGATVRLRGDSGRATTMNVTSYEVLSIDGQTPFVGTLVKNGSVTRLATGSDTLTLQNPPKGLSAGGKYWVVGPRDGNSLKVGSYGLIRR